MRGIRIIMTTFEPGQGHRAAYAKTVLESLVVNLRYRSSLALHVADDGSKEPAKWIAQLCSMAQDEWGVLSTTSNAQRRGIGASLNLALKDWVPEWLWFYTTDDWLLTSQLNLNVAAMLIDELGYDMVRLGPTHPGLSCTTRFQRGLGWWLDVDSSKGGYAFATRPFIATKQFYDFIGPFDEGLDSYETERLYAERVAGSGARIACLHLDGPWTHIGEHNVGKTKTGLVAV